MSMCLCFADMLHSKILPLLGEENEDRCFAKLRGLMSSGEDKYEHILSAVQQHVSEYLDQDDPLGHLLQHFGLPLDVNENDSKAQRQTYLCALVLQSVRFSDSAQRKPESVVRRYVQVGDDWVEKKSLSDQAKAAGKGKENEKEKEQETEKETGHKQEGLAGDELHSDTNVEEQKRIELRPQLADLSLYEPCLSFISKMAASLRRDAYRDALSFKIARLEKERRHMELAQRQAAELVDIMAFAEHHSGLPVYFTQEMVDRHNAANPANRISLAIAPDGLPTGMLLPTGHCALEKCQYYLQRPPGGLSAHLRLTGIYQPRQSKCRNYVTGFHWHATALIRNNPTLSFESFKERMNRLVAGMSSLVDLVVSFFFFFC
eukprot:TRINITY_DN7042_c0_g1_i7.p1 TRINITY_DN7042_c0_g1~~TRINITY_DN7042_c0_g1_i7.p1  ORF type:complete len:375 (-),score=55.99 TRINITY_DN7042_c0_g1_i7:48-1172(-)